jgi:metal transporter CNNM
VREFLTVREAQMVSRILESTHKYVEPCMIPLERVFSLNIDSFFDPDTRRSLSQSGFSRIPVYSGSKGNIRGFLHIKGLVLVDVWERAPLKECSISQPVIVGRHCTLGMLLHLFQVCV